MSRPCRTTRRPQIIHARLVIGFRSSSRRSARPRHRFGDQERLRWGLPAIHHVHGQRCFGARLPRTIRPMDLAELRYGRFLLLIIGLAFLVGALVQAVRTIPDPDLFNSSTGTIVGIAVVVAVVAAVVLRPPAWLLRKPRSVGKRDRT